MQAKVSATGLSIAVVIAVSAPWTTARAEHSTYLTKRGTTEMVSLNSQGDKGEGDSCVDRPSISDDGRYVAFASSAHNLHPSDTNGPLSDVFVRDRKRGRTILVSKTVHGPSSHLPNDLNDLQQLDCVDWSYLPSISGNGRYVAFTSHAPLIKLEEDRPAGARPVAKVFVYDRKTDKTDLVSMAKDGGVANASSGMDGSDISNDGRYVVFESAATDLIDLPGCSDRALPLDPPVGSIDCNNQTYLYDREQKKTVLVTRSTDGGLPNNDLTPFGQSVSPAQISDDGSFVVFGSRATNLVDNDLNVCAGHLPSCDDVYRYDVKREKVELVTVGRTGFAGNNASYSTGGGQFINSDGRFVVFRSDATDMVPAGEQGVFVRDMKTGRTEQTSVSSNGRDIDGTGVSINDDGRYVGFYGSDCGHDPPICATSMLATLYHDRRTGQTDVVRVLQQDGHQIEQGIYPSDWSLSGRGRQAVWDDDDGDGTAGVFLQDFKVTGLGTGTLGVGKSAAGPRVVDLPADSSPPGGIGEILEARAAYRPGLEDIYLRLDVATLGVAIPSVLEAPAISYDFGFTSRGIRYVVATTGSVYDSRSTLSKCSTGSECRQIAVLQGEWGTVGEAIVVSVPTRLLGPQDPAIREFTATSFLDTSTGTNELDHVR